MYLRNYIKVLFIIIISTSVALFVYSAFALFSGRVMEKEYTKLTQEFTKQANKYRTQLMESGFTVYESKFLSSKYESGLSVAKLCYSDDTLAKLTEEQQEAILSYNEECKKKGIPESTVRPEIDEIYQSWINTRKPMEESQEDINNRLYADNSGKGKMDREMINTFAIVAWVGIILSMILLLIFVRVPKEEKESKSRSKKDE